MRLTLMEGWTYDWVLDARYIHEYYAHGQGARHRIDILHFATAFTFVL